MKWHVGDPTGTVIVGTPGVFGNTSTLLNTTMAARMDQWSNLYVVDRSNNRIQLFCSGTTTGMTVARTGTGGSTLRGPYDVAFDSQMNFLIRCIGSSIIDNDNALVVLQQTFNYNFEYIFQTRLTTHEFIDYLKILLSKHNHDINNSSIIDQT
ncbi:unnamed protein product [Didymodactylos carnosus]|uniref:Uncharacterized protein n=1 Tax=Didymodactylos carnosus TaxID=1234261 RepID=A0A814LGV4_9BILA|nr:unnamed protein product [Didymodactylos carnosus]CAF3831396.1 unnamed protein product [Didymodactylos carnosus]